LEIHFPRRSYWDLDSEEEAKLEDDLEVITAARVMADCPIPSVVIMDEDGVVELEAPTVDDNDINEAKIAQEIWDDYIGWNNA
jgi:hypothetical protein